MRGKKLKLIAWEQSADGLTLRLFIGACLKGTCFKEPNGGWKCTNHTIGPGWGRREAQLLLLKDVLEEHRRELKEMVERYREEKENVRVLQRALEDRLGESKSKRR